MNIQVESTNFHASQDLIDHMKEVFSDLNKYNDQLLSIDIYMESTHDEKSDKRVKIKALSPGHEVFMQEDAEDFVTAAQTVFDKAKRVLADQKDKDKEHQQRRPDKVY